MRWNIKGSFYTAKTVVGTYLMDLDRTELMLMTVQEVDGPVERFINVQEDIPFEGDPDTAATIDMVKRMLKVVAQPMQSDRIARHATLWQN